MSEPVIYPIYDIECPACHWTFGYALPPEAARLRCKSCWQWHWLADLRAGQTLYRATGTSTTRPESTRWWATVPQETVQAIQRALRPH